MKTAKAKPEEKEEKLACSFCGSSRAKAFYVLCPTCIAAKEQGEINAVRQFIERVGVRYASDKPWAAVDIYLRFMREELKEWDEKGRPTE